MAEESCVEPCTISIKVKNSTSSITAAKAVNSYIANHRLSHISFAIFFPSHLSDSLPDTSSRRIAVAHSFLFSFFSSFFLCYSEFPEVYEKCLRSVLRGVAKDMQFRGWMANSVL